LIQTGKIHANPVILVGTDFWQPLEAYIKKVLLESHGTINKKDLDLFIITDDHEVILKKVTETPVRR
jgi:predicted Rossmann-fold nucleotide-binding protein